MNPLNSIFGLLAALLIQLSVFQPYLGSMISCETKADIFCACCEDLDSCPCLKEADPGKTPAPLVSPDSDLKQIVSMPNASLGVTVLLAGTAVFVGPESDLSFIDPFADVSRSVVFCSFQI